MYLRLYVLAIVSICSFAGFWAAYQLFPQHRAMISNAAKSWFSLNTLAFLSPHQLVFFPLAALILWRNRPQDTDSYIFYFVVVFFALPGAISWKLVLGGAYLLKLHYLMLCVAVLLLPLIFRPKPESKQPNNNKNLILTLGPIFFTLIVALDTRDQNITGILRLCVHHLLLTGACLFCFNRLVITTKTIHYFLLGIFVAALPMSLIGSFQALAGWELYPSLKNTLYDTSGNAFRAYSRGTFIRTPGTSLPIPFGMFMGMALIIYLYFRNEVKSKIIGLGFIPFFLLAIYASGSRAAILLILISIFILCFYSRAFKGFQGITKVFMVIFYFAFISTGVLFEYLISKDTHGTFAYRAQLLEVGLGAMQDAFWWGDPDHMQNPKLQVMRQGQGIIDMVNTYLIYALNYGFFVISLLFLMIFTCARKLILLRKQFELADNPDEYCIRVFLGLFIAFFICIGTVSMVDRIDYYLWFFIGIAGMATAHHLSPQPTASKNFAPEH